MSLVDKNRLQALFLQESLVERLMNRYVDRTPLPPNRVPSLPNCDLYENPEEYRLTFRNGQACAIRKNPQFATQIRFEENFDVIIQVKYIPVGGFRYTIYDTFLGYPYPRDLFGRIRRKLRPYLELETTRTFQIGIEIIPRLTDHYPEILRKICEKRKTLGPDDKVCVIYETFESEAVSEEDAQKIYRSQNVALIRADQL